MKVCTPAIAWHNRERVSAVDFQPVSWPKANGPDGADRTRVASGGDDHHVVIWEVSSDSAGKSVLRPLCDLSRHQNCVNAVRWAPDGRVLASGDSDFAVFLWQHAEADAGGDAAPDIFGEDYDENDADAANVASGDDGGKKENWTVSRILRGHLQDVIDLSFSPCGAQLVSCSIDGSAIVFDVAKGNKVKILPDHKGWVNGVAWAPAPASSSSSSSVVATLASDRVLRFYKAKSFKIAGKISKCVLPVGDSSADPSAKEKSVRLFHDDTFPSFYRRLDFSPDGQLLAVPSGVLDVEGVAAAAQHCTYLFSRAELARPALYLPHRECSVAVRFSPVRYRLRQQQQQQQKQDDKDLKPWEKVPTLFCLPYRLVYAVATENDVLFYDTQQAEPFAKVSKIHYIRLTDLTWSPDGNILTVSSTDGFCSLITFKEGEIGQVYREEEDAETKEVEEAVEDKAVSTKAMEVEEEQANS